MALATQEDVEQALRRPLTTEELEYLSEPLEAASDHVVGYLHPFPVPTPTPDAVKRVVAEMVAALLSRPSTDALPLEVKSMQVGPYGSTFAAGATSLGPYLTEAMKLRLRPFRPSAVSIALGSGRG